MSTHRAAFARVETKSSCAIQGERVHNSCARTLTKPGGGGVVGEVPRRLRNALSLPFQ